MFRKKCTHNFKVYEVYHDATALTSNHVVTVFTLLCSKCGKRKREKHDGVLTLEDYLKIKRKMELNSLYGKNAFKE